MRPRAEQGRVEGDLHVGLFVHPAGGARGRGVGAELPLGQAQAADLDAVEEDAGPVIGPQPQRGGPRRALGELEAEAEPGHQRPA
ncbi:MAG: hypothetical protein ACK559_03165, partial [bacterium]